MDSETPDHRAPDRRALWLLRGTGAFILVCALVQAVLLWVANRFYAVPSGQVLPEMRVVLETRFAITDAARWFESALLVGGRWLGVVLLVQAVQRSVPAKQQWKELGILAGGMLLVTVPWNLAAPFWNYGYAIVAVLCNAALFLMIGLFVGWLLQKRR